MTKTMEPMMRHSAFPQNVTHQDTKRLDTSQYGRQEWTKREKLYWLQDHVSETARGSNQFWISVGWVLSYENILLPQAYFSFNSMLFWVKPLLKRVLACETVIGVGKLDCDL